VKTGLLAAFLGLASSVAGAQVAREPLEGRPLSEAVRALESRGLQVIFSSELVRPEMRVGREPRAREPRKALEEILAPHGLALRRGPAGRWLVISAPKPRASPAPTAPASEQERIRFEEEVEVAAKPHPEVRAALPVTSAQVSATAGGLENVFHTLQLLPGVTAPQDFGGRLAVRGGGPDQNMTVMDGVEIHNPYRLLGLTSAFNPETIERFELFTGAFSARHGDRLSSLLIVDGRDGSDARKLQGSASLGLTDSNVVFEGRLPGQRRGSWLATARRTYYDLVVERFYHANFPGFADVQAKATWEPRPGHRAAFQAVLSREGTEMSSDEIESENNEFRVRARTTTPLLSGVWDAPLGAQARLRSIVSYSRLTDTFDFDSLVHLDSRRSNAPVDEVLRDRVVFVRTVGVRDLAFREELSLFRGRHAFDAGLELHGMRSRWGVTNTGDTPVSLTGAVIQVGHTQHLHPDAVDASMAGVRLGAWIEDRLQVSPRLTLVPGLRFDHVSWTGETLVSPRLAATLNLGRATRLKLATGLHYQSPGYEKLFLADDFVDLSAGGALRSERALQLVLGVEHDLGAGLGLRLEAYDRRLDRLIVGRLETEVERQARVGRYDFPASLREDVPAGPFITAFPVNEGRGRASGLELTVSRKPGSPQARLAGWFSYSLSRARRDAYGLTLPFAYDRRHSASLVGQLRFSPRLELSLAGHAASGIPFTPARRARVSPVEDLADLDGDGDRNEWIPAREESSGGFVYEPDLGPISNINSRRLPGIARLDFRLSWKPRGAAGRWLFYLDVINALGRRNGFLVAPELRFDPAGDGPTVFHRLAGGFPRLPSFGVRFRF
jgi:outer membrane receptor protein involved in Fe transport